MALAMDRHFFASERTRLGYTQDRFATVLDVNVYTIKKWEGGSRKIPAEMGYVLIALANGLEPVGVDFLVPLPRVTGYIIAAIQAELKPAGVEFISEIPKGSKADKSED
ncbi:helix-turn-helix domain-containing protein [Rhizobium ruizarguesonis]